MKKFAWRLQRLLDIKIKQEDVMRSELVAVTEQALAVRSGIMVRKAALRKLLTDLSAKQAQQRLNEQEFFFKYAHVSEAEIKKLGLKLAKLEKVRHSKIRRL